MTMNSWRIFHVTLLLLSFLHGAQASDFAKEQRWADQIVDALLDGEAQWLRADGREFLSIYTQAESDAPQFGVIVLHGIGVHPNWDQVIYPLRTGLVEYGMATLSLQLPILPNDAEPTAYAPLIPQAGPRIAAGIEYLEQQGAQRIVIVAHSMGSTMAARYLAESASPVAGFVAVGMQVRDRGPGTAADAMLGKISIPVLDLYGSDDLQGVLDTAARRAAAASANNHYSQLQVPGADHFFDGKNDVLVKTVADWIAAL